eukprot:CAMPEP_0113651032 /NCGR_PEP_ID=MMETSP0017_2-20120614/27188_1 /TAXON_ID=2856 /ORGANISM="Cylindrotheca closterium" /LENGTH=347 /DNA_ID=CAMNT_0000563649 /DNA_START=43 /DNA_END=1086 /DNA_ORIENTATION=+ /assembly_acc=CAM_ASM_000147
MRNWADHCSSDEESLGEEIAAELEGTQLKDEVQHEEQVAEEPEHVAPEHVEPEVQEAPPPAEKTYNFPSQPPFTAFIGNLAYSVDDGEKLKEALSDVIAHRLGPGKVNVLNGRIATDRQNGRHRGFGYVEVETVDQLKLLMEINDGQSQIAGRKIQLDTATARRDNNNNRRNNNRNHNFDGSKFRGGRFGNKGGNDNNDAPPAQRTGLKLAPRSKPREVEGNGSSSDIFGGTKARDEGVWQKKKLEGGDRRRNNQNKGRGGGRGGKGRNDGGQGHGGHGGHGGRGGNKNKKNNNRKPQESAPKGEQPKAPPASKPEPAKPAPAKSAPPAKKAAPVNKFALLMDSDSD